MATPDPDGSRIPFGAKATPTEALGAVAAALEEWYRPDPSAPAPALRLEARSTELPDIRLALVPDRRLFSRTLALEVSAEADGAGPAQDVALQLSTPGVIRRRRRFTMTGQGPKATTDGAERFERAGIMDGIRRMTNVRELSLAWSAGERRWRLRLVTLAGALIGTSPLTSVAVPLEPDDGEGLILILRAFLAGAAG